MDMTDKLDIVSAAEHHLLFGSSCLNVPALILFGRQIDLSHGLLMLLAQLVQTQTLCLILHAEIVCSITSF